MAKYCFASNYAVPVNLNASDFWTSAGEMESKEKKKRNINEISMDIAKDETLTKEEFKKQQQHQRQ